MVSLGGADGRVSRPARVRIDTCGRHSSGLLLPSSAELASRSCAARDVKDCRGGKGNGHDDDANVKEGAVAVAGVVAAAASMLANGAGLATAAALSRRADRRRRGNLGKWEMACQ